MSLKRYKPTTPSRRGSSVLKHDRVGEQGLEHHLLRSMRSRSGRNNQGKITVRHQGNHEKRHYRVMDFIDPIAGKPARVIGLQYDPNRTAQIALLSYASGAKAYTLAVNGLAVGDMIEVAVDKALEIKNGNRMPLKYIPAGMMVCNLELVSGRGGKAVRGAGSGALVLSSEANYVQLKMPSGEIRKLNGECLATVGQVSNIEHNLVRLGKAGRMRHHGTRPRVRGKAMNPVDHPHGGGEGHNPIGMKHPKTPWGKPAMGVKTRKSNRSSDALIIRRRTK